MSASHVTHTTLQRESRFWVAWNYLVLLGISWYAISVPISIALDLDNRGWSYILDMAWTLFFAVDMFLNFRRPYLEKGELVTNRRDTARHYLRSWFAVDFIATFPFDLLLLLLHGNQPWVVHAMRMARILKVFRLFRITDVVVTLSASGKKALVTDVVLDAHTHIKVALLFFWVLVGLNGIACGWIMINPQHLTGDPLSDYIFGLYWTITTLTTVGYGDITPAGNLARIYTMIIMAGGVVMYGLVIGNISSLIANNRRLVQQRCEKIAALANFLKQYQIPKHLQDDIFSFYNHYLSERGVEQSEIIAELPTELQSNINVYVNVFMLRRVPFFADASQECLAAMVGFLTTRIISPHEEIISAGEQGREMFFLTHGVVEVVSPEGKSLAKLRAGAFFGEMALFRDVTRTATVRALTFCDTYVLKKDDFENVLKIFPDFQAHLDEMVRERRDVKTRISTLIQTGAASIDEEHRKLLAMVQLLKEQKISRRRIGEIIHELRHHTQEHFAHEEHLMKLHDYPDLKKHANSHAQFVLRLDGIEKAIMLHKHPLAVEMDRHLRKKGDRDGNKQGEAFFVTPQKRLLGFLTQWLIYHVNQEDQDLVQFLAQSGVDLKTV